jgi:hypothetical protein
MFTGIILCKKWVISSVDELSDVREEGVGGLLLLDE